MTFEQIMTHDAIAAFKATGEISQDMHDRLFDHYCASGEMPYGTMKAKTGDPYLWILDKVAEELGEAIA
jgi:hypothetical protein